MTVPESQESGEVEPVRLGSPEAKASFLLRLRASGIRDLAVLRAMEAIPRGIFVPYRYADLAPRDIALPIGCGQTMSEPGFVARVLETLECAAAHRVMEVGSGSGYVTALLSRLAREVVAIERFHRLSLEAEARLDQLGIGNVSVIWADGLAAIPAGCFDRILLHASVEDLPAALLDALSPEGVIVYPQAVRAEPGRSGPASMVRVRRRPDGTPDKTTLFGCRLASARPGRSQLL